MPKKITDTCGIIMMAGMGTRMVSEHPKVLHEACGKPMGWWVLDSCDRAGLVSRVIVVGHHANEVKVAFPSEKHVLQKPQKGTGHAVMVGMKEVPKECSQVMVLSGDVPCLGDETIRQLIEIHRKVKSSATVLSFFPPDPSGYGRIIRNKKNEVEGIIEDKDLSGEQREIEECNSGIYVFDREFLEKALKKIKPSERSGEYHLPDVLKYMLETGGTVIGAATPMWIEATGVNTRAELSEAGDYLRWRVAKIHMEKGVTIIAPSATWIGPEVKIGKDSIIHPGTIIMGKCTIGTGTSIGPYSELHEVKIGNNCNIRHSVLSESRIDDDVKIGPYAHIRPGTRIRTGAKVGNFVEMKKTDFGKGSKSGHLTYLGDAEVGDDVNVGAGTITCNYDGKKKHKTVIGNGVFIGSDSILVAPIKIGKNSYTAAGSTLNQDVPDNSLAFGRARQIVKKGWIKKKK